VLIAPYGATVIYGAENVPAERITLVLDKRSMLTAMIAQLEP
jgi:hypothetical protein